MGRKLCLVSKPLPRFYCLARSTGFCKRQHLTKVKVKAELPRYYTRFSAAAARPALHHGSNFGRKSCFKVGPTANFHISVMHLNVLLMTLNSAAIWGCRACKRLQCNFSRELPREYHVFASLKLVKARTMRSVMRSYHSRVTANVGQTTKRYSKW